VNGPRGLRRGDSAVGIFHKVEAASLLNLLTQYQSSLIDSDIEKISIANTLVADSCLENLKSMLLNNASVFQNDESGKSFIHALNELCKNHKTYLYWKKIKDAFHAGHLSQQRLETYQTAKESGIALPPSTPAQTIKPNLRMFKEYRSALKAEYHPHANAMIDHLDKISFTQLKILLKELANKLNQHVCEKQYNNVFIFHRGKIKSEYWILMLIYPFLNFKIADVIELGNDYDFSSDINQAIILKLQTRLHSKNSCLILIDDGTYSGNQCLDHILHIAFRLEQIRKNQPEYFNEATIELIFAFAYATQHASNLINQSLKLLSAHSLPIPCDLESLIQKVHLFFEKKILTTKEMNWGELQADYETSISAMLTSGSMQPDEVDRLTMVYTDWRTPDNLSSPAAFFKAAPPISLCLEEKKTELHTKQRHEHLLNDEQHIIPVNLQSPYK
jgi:hypothetical protein